MFILVNSALSNAVFDVLLPFFSSQYLLVPSLVVLAVLLYAGTTQFRSYVLRVLAALLLAGVVLAIANHVTGSPPPFLSGVGRAFVNNTWHALQSGNPVPVPVEPMRPFPYGACLAAVLLFGLAGIRRWTLWLTIPLNACALWAPVYCGCCWPGATLAAWAIGAASFLGVQMLPGSGGFADLSSVAPLLREQPRERRILASILAGWVVLTFIRLYCLDYVHYDIQGDLSQYWYWTRRLQWCYYSKPPMIALVNAVLCRLLGDTAIALRTGGVLLFGAALLPVYALTKRITGKERAALVAAVLLMAMPEFSLFAGYMDTHKPAYLIWAAALYTGHRAFHGERRMWAVTGLMIGLGLMTRFTFPFLAVALAVTVILYHRGRLREWGPYVSFLCALMCILGLLYWQYEHHWITLEDIGLEGRDSGQTPAPLEFFLYQTLFVSPVIFLIFLYSMGAMTARSAKNADAGMLMLAFLVPFMSFAVLSFSREISVSWPQCAYLAAAPAAAWILTESRRQKLMTILLTIGIAVALATSALLYRTYLQDEAPTGVWGASKWVEHIQSHYDPTGANAPFIMANDYGIASTISFYTPGHPDIYCWGGTISCHDLCAWTDWSALAGRDALAVLQGGPDNAENCIKLLVSDGVFTDGECIDSIHIRRWNHDVYDACLVRLCGFSGQEMCDFRFSGQEMRDFMR